MCEIICEKVKIIFKYFSQEHIYYILIFEFTING